MKKILAMLLAAMMLLSLAACGEQNAPETTAAPAGDATTQATALHAHTLAQLPLPPLPGKLFLLLSMSHHTARATTGSGPPTCCFFMEGGNTGGRERERAEMGNGTSRADRKLKGYSCPRLPIGMTGPLMC